MALFQSQCQISRSFIFTKILSNITQRKTNYILQELQNETSKSTLYYLIKILQFILGSAGISCPHHKLPTETENETETETETENGNETGNETETETENETEIETENETENETETETETENETENETTTTETPETTTTETPETEPTETPEESDVVVTIDQNTNRNFHLQTSLEFFDKNSADKIQSKKY